MNTIEEIMKMKNETIYDAYKRILCPECKNKDEAVEKDLCNIVKTMDNGARCINYKRCMENKCNTCIDNIKCFNE